MTVTEQTRRDRVIAERAEQGLDTPPTDPATLRLLADFTERTRRGSQ